MACLSSPLEGCEPGLLVSGVNIKRYVLVLLPESALLLIFALLILLGLYGRLAVARERQARSEGQAQSRRSDLAWMGDRRTRHVGKVN